MPDIGRSLDEYVTAFERARQSEDATALEAFLPPADDPLFHEVLRELIRIDMEFGWESNRPRTLEDYRARFPSLFDDPDSLREVAFEEYRLRRRAGQSPTPQEYARRYGVRTDGWPATSPTDESPALAPSIRLDAESRSFHAFAWAGNEESSVRLEDPTSTAQGEEADRLFRDLLASDRSTGGRLAEGLAALPGRAGGECLGFRLVAELGAGAFGRVYLARQPGLADRPVALKVSPDVGAESQALAQLQHTHIVPIHSVHRSGALQAVCMPFCGTATVADVLRDLQTRPELPRTGPELLAVLGRKPRPAGVPAASGPTTALKTLDGRSYPDAVLWLGSCLAAGLAHAHERGILHRDVKPANVLLSDEGLPMLLDFNLADDVKQRGATAAMVGGTLPYMAPERLAAFLTSASDESNVASAGSSPPPTVEDGRSDVYSLGIVLFELLTGRFPFSPIRLPTGPDADSALDHVALRAIEERRAGPPCPRRFNPAVSPAAASLVRHCLEPDPARRYPSAAALREDLDRHLADLPLKYAPEPSLAERARKWGRRHPRLAVRLGIAGGVLLLVTACVLGVLHYQDEQAKQAEAIRRDFQEDFRRAQVLLCSAPDGGKQRREGWEDVCRTALERYAVLDDEPWQQRWQFQTLKEDLRHKVTGQVGELLFHLARAVAKESEDIELARTYNRKAEECFEANDVPGILYRQRAWLCGKAGEKDEALRAKEQAQEAGMRSLRARFLEAHALTLEKEFQKALKLLAPAVQESSRAFLPGRAGQEASREYWPWFLLGLCHERLGQHRLAVYCFSVCVGLDPEFEGAFVERGLAHLRLRQWGDAKANFDRVIELVPHRPETYFDRALALEGLKKWKEALDNLEEARQRGLSATRVYFLRAQVRIKAGDQEGAKREEEEGLKRRPSDDLSWNARGYFRLMRKKDYKGAMADFEEALKINPELREALMNKANVLAETIDKKVSRRTWLRRQKEALVPLERIRQLYPNYAPGLAGEAVVLARLGRRDEAHERIGEALAADPNPEVRYQAGCVFALTSAQMAVDTDRAFAYLYQAIEAGYGREILKRDPDLDDIRNTAAFRRLLERAQKLLGKG